MTIIKYKIPEFVVGTIASYASITFFPILKSMNDILTSAEYRSVVDVTSLPYINAVVISGVGVLVATTYIIIAVYCYGKCIESVVDYAMER